MGETQACPLCSHQAALIAQNRVNRFFHCPECQGVSADEQKLLGAEDEKKRYDSHDNRLDDQRYLDFLSKLAVPLKKYLTPKSLGLDYGCGPVKAMEHLLQDEFQIDSYDLFFYPDQKFFQKKYDFILASEVVEHLYHPQKVFKQFSDLLKDSGYLGIMTQSWDEKTDFSRWWYANDPTHVFFYHSKTIQYLSEELGFQILESSSNVFILQKT